MYDVTEFVDKSAPSSWYWSQCASCVGGLLLQLLYTSISGLLGSCLSACGGLCSDPEDPPPPRFPPSDDRVVHPPLSSRIVALRAVTTPPRRYSLDSKVAHSPSAIRRNSRKFSLPVAVMPSENEGSSVLEAAGGDAKPEKERYRVVVLGPPKVGKTAIITQFLYDRFVPHYKETVEELHRGEYNISGCPLKLDIMDTSGSNEFPAMRALSISNADAFILVYAVDKEDSFEEVRQLRELILTTRPENIPLVVVGNKCDVSDEKRQVNYETADSIVTIDWKNGFVEASAKNNTNIIAVFKELLNQANVPYDLTPAVYKRRQSLPNYTPLPRHGLHLKPVKRESCVIS